MAYKFNLPENVIMGENALDFSEGIIKGLGKKAFIVTGKIVTKTGITKKLTDCLDKWNIEYVVYTDIVGEPTDVMIADGVEKYLEGKCDFLIGIGGGSPLDSVKAIAAMSVLPGKIADYLGTEIVGKFPPMILIPTTSGTGSETTKFTIITDSTTDVKMLIKGDALLPQVAIVDPEFSISAPPSITAATGMDALTHAVEAYTSRKGNALTAVYAISAIKRIFEYLPAAYADGNNKKAREEMAIASFEAGVCINNASVTLVHGMSRPIGALFHVPHGMSNAILIKECLNYAMDGCYDRFAAIGKAIGVATDAQTDKEAAQAFMQALDALCKKLDIPTLEQYGIDKTRYEDNIDKMAQDAMNSGSPSNTMKDIAKYDLIIIYNRLWP